MRADLVCNCKCSISRLVQVPFLVQMGFKILAMVAVETRCVCASAGAFSGCPIPEALPLVPQRAWIWAQDHVLQWCVGLHSGSLDDSHVHDHPPPHHLGWNFPYRHQLVGRTGADCVLPRPIRCAGLLQAVQAR